MPPRPEELAFLRHLDAPPPLSVRRFPSFTGELYAASKGIDDGGADAFVIAAAANFRNAAVALIDNLTMGMLANAPRFITSACTGIGLGSFCTWSDGRAGGCAAGEMITKIDENRR